MSIRNADIRRRGGDLFDELSSRGKAPLKIIPLRFPIVEETYGIIQVINEPVGMVERYILEAVCEFGACDIAVIDDLLCLGESLIIDLIEKLIHEGVDIQKEGNRITGGDSLKNSVQRQSFEKRVKHRRTLVVNPLTGDLLPITHVEDASRWLIPFVTEREESDLSDWLRVRCGDRAVSGARAVAKALSSTDSEKREQIGIPEGAVKLVDDACLDRKLYSVVAFAVVTPDMMVEVYSAIDFSIQLSNLETSLLSYWNLACHDVQPWVFDEPDTSDAIAEDFTRNLNGVECRAHNENTLAVSVQLPQQDLCVDSRNENSASKAMNMLQMDLINGWYWKVKDFSIWRIIAGDAETESRLIVLRAVGRLREMFRNRTKSDSVELRSWWEEFQNSSLQRYNREAGAPIIDFDRLMIEAEQVPDTRFLDWLEDVTVAKDEGR